jgi:hypothetical protein
VCRCLRPNHYFVLIGEGQGLEGEADDERSGAAQGVRRNISGITTGTRLEMFIDYFR